MKNTSNTKDKSVVTQPTNRFKLSFSALDPFVESNIIRPTEKAVRGQSFIEYGERNQYPNYLWSLYKEVPTLGSIVNGVVDYVCGSAVHTNDFAIFKTDKKAAAFMKKVALDIAVFGGCYINVIKNAFGGVAQLEVLDYRNVRSDKKNTWFYYSEDFSTKSYGRCRYHVYPVFTQDEKSPNTVYYIKSDQHQTYASPLWAQAVISCEIEKSINEYQLNEINNGFMSNVIVTMLNGVPTDEMKEEIEELFYEKFTGKENAARPLINYAPDKDHAIQVDKVDSDNFADRYEALEKRARQQIFTTWRANPNLFGIPTESLGFSSEEYQSAYGLFHNTVILPIRNMILDSLEEILGKDGAIVVDDFKIDFGETN